MSTDKATQEALLKALRKGQADKMARLLDADVQGVTVDMAADSASNSILHRAARYGHSDVVEMLLTRGADPNHKNKFLMTPLHHAAVEGNSDVIAALIASGGNADAADDRGRRPLHWASGYGHLRGVEVILEGGGVSMEPDNEGWTPLHRCCQEKPPELVKKSKDDAKEVEAAAAPADPAAELMAQDGVRAEIAALLLHHGANAGAGEPKGSQTPLHLAAMNGYAQVIRALLKDPVGAAKIDTVNRIGQTPLMYAINQRHLGTVRALLEHGADVGKGDTLHFGWTPLHLAVLQDDVSIVEALLDAGADLTARDANGMDAETLAEDHHKTNVQKLLKRKNVTAT